MAPQHRLYTPEVAETILERLSDGEALKAICRTEGMPSAGAVNWWVVTDHEGFAVRYARAREVGLALMADETMEIADFGKNDTYADEEGNIRTDHDVVTRSRLRVDTRKWLLSKLLPKTYGDKLDLNHSGEMTLKAQPDERIESRIADILGKAGATGVVGGKRTSEGEAED